MFLSAKSCFPWKRRVREALSFCSFWFRLTLSIFHITTLDVDIPCALDMGFFAADGVGDLLGLLDGPLAHCHLFAHVRLFLDRHLLLTHRDAVGLPLANRLISRLARTGTALEVDFPAGERHIDALFLGHHVFTQAGLTRLDRLLLGTKLLLTQLELLLALCPGLILGASSGSRVGCLGSPAVEVIASVAPQNVIGFTLSISRVDHHYVTTRLKLTV